MITVFYDGKCGLCAKEINHYKKIAPKHLFYWVDINDNPRVLKKYNISQEMALKRLHALDNNGILHIGVDSFILIWKEIKYFKILAYCVSLPLIKPVMQYLYGKFADIRFKKLDHCQITMHNQ